MVGSTGETGKGWPRSKAEMRSLMDMPGVSDKAC